MNALLCVLVGVSVCLIGIILYGIFTGVGPDQPLGRRHK